MRLLLSLILLSISIPSLAATAIITSAEMDHDSITIAGSNFEPTNPTIFWDDVQSNMISQKAHDGDAVLTGPGLRWLYGGKLKEMPVTFQSSTKTRGGSLGTSYLGEGPGGYLRQPLLPDLASLKRMMLVSWWYKPSESPSDQGGSNKFIRVWDHTNGYGTRISWTHMHFTCNNDTTWGKWPGNVNEWNHHLIYVDLEKSNVKTWVNGQLSIDAKCTKHINWPDNQLFIGLIGFDHGSDAYKTMKTNLDDIYVGTSLARVEISNSSSWSQDFISEILPATEWSTKKIVAKAHKGVVDLSTNLYVYVFDKDGIVNTNGIKVSCSKCPKPPQPL